ncbi:PREDICTED: uncharacterized protein LOC106749584 [Dinoponera quadriceps]|uniref:Uncharacterized protein LOC106749584 n=1 Tax=Dinoponera quadriceps TaxID=609295 RepID=A0A6P3Y387_DINQU|nr:PREDICTED: uncharacterized protein LOC106749584 [Dinoponera quadriceps]
MSFKIIKNSSRTMECTASETQKLIRGQRDVSRNADTSQYASGNTRERQAVLYLKEKRIYNIVEFLIGNLLLRRPYDPYEYLGQLLDRYILSRSGLVDSSFPFPFHSA